MKNKKKVLLASTTAVSAVLLGSIGGTAYALWNVEQSTGFTKDIAKTYYTVKTPGSEAKIGITDNNSSLNRTLEFPKSQNPSNPEVGSSTYYAKKLLEDESVVIPVEVDWKIEGDAGYSLTINSWVSNNPQSRPSLISSSKDRVWAVDSIDKCNIPKDQWPEVDPSDVIIDYDGNPTNKANSLGDNINATLEKDISASGESRSYDYSTQAGMKKIYVCYGYSLKPNRTYENTVTLKNKNAPEGDTTSTSTWSNGVYSKPEEEESLKLTTFLNPALEGCNGPT